MLVTESNPNNPAEIHKIVSMLTGTGFSKNAKVYTIEIELNHPINPAILLEETGLFEDKASLQNLVSFSSFT